MIDMGIYDSNKEFQECGFESVSIWLWQSLALLMRSSIHVMMFVVQLDFEFNQLAE